MKHLRSFTVTYVPFTNTKPSRVRLYDNRYRKQTHISFTDSKHDSVEQIAAEWLRDRGVPIRYFTQGRKGFVLLTDVFEPVL